MRSFATTSTAGLCLLLAACSAAPVEDIGSRSEPVRSITRAEALADFDQITASFRGLYGALTRKEARYGFQLDALAAEYRARVQAANGETQYRRIFEEFIARFKDAHVSLSADLVSDDAHAFGLPFRVMPVGDTFVVYEAAQGSTAQVGDELLSIDGRSATDLTNSFLPLIGIANELAARHFAAAHLTRRPVYASEGLQANARAQVRLRNAHGAERTEVVTWQEAARLLPAAPPAPVAGGGGLRAAMAVSHVTAEVVRAELSKFGERLPFFMTDAVRASLGVAGEVAPSRAALQRFGLTPQQGAAIHFFATTYSLGGKKVLLVRIPSYVQGEAALNYLRALFSEQQPQVDALVFDQTHNPGGSLGFAEGVVSLLAPHRINGDVQRMHADRLWIQTFAKAAKETRDANPADPAAAIYEGRAHDIDAAYSSNQPLSIPIPISLEPTIEPDAAHWSKPILLLSDELSVSCADIVPLLLKANHIATLFGQTTMGGGGNVEAVATLTNTQAVLNLSRGIGTVYDPTGQYPEENIIEDNGVAPDVGYSHTLADFRAGYIGYVRAFNDALAARL
ncbi:S41 family peptidase [Pendulispora brunnea]|uniref:S41 family peptidase n=1 Tax=Pendulispora brunnea TaxID=2905690 RepID=A0ABZ2KE58_9BACT